MKKSFMTRVLAMGLSFAMAFSLSAATNVTTASAAAKKVGVTTMMKVSTKSVTEGKTVKTYMNSTALKKYRIKKVAKLSAVADKYIDVDVITTGKKARQGLEITAHEGAVTAAKLTKKGVYVTIYFAQTTSATKAAKATAKKYAKLKVAVQAKPVEKLTMTAKATKVKQITVTFNKEVDTTAAKITVKKNTATPTVSEVKFDDTKKVATLAMAGKLTKGTYTVTATVGDETVTADAIVEKDETLTSFALVGNTLKAYANNSSAASIKFDALNQYEEKMSGANVTATIAPGTTDSSKLKNPTATKSGEIHVKDIPTMYTIPGAEFSVIIVDSTGTTFKGTAVYGASAKASKLTSAGLYNVNKGKIMDMTAGDTVANYEALFTAKDQYNDDYTISDAEVGVGGTASITVSVAGGITNVKAGTFTAAKRTVNDKDYFAVPLTHVSNKTGETVAIAGTFDINVVNNNVGIIGTETYTVLPNVEIKSLSVSADVVYAAQGNTMTYTATDLNGNEVTKYDELKKINWNAGSQGGKLEWSRNADGTAKLTYTAPSIATGLKSTMETFTATANTPVGGNYFVQTYTFTVSAKRYATAVVGINSSIARTTAVSGKTIEVPFNKLLIEDQYGNLFTEAELKKGELVSASSVFVTSASVNADVKTATTGAINAWEAKCSTVAATVSGGSISTSTGKYVFAAPRTNGAVTAKYKFFINGKMADAYTVTFNKVAKSAMATVSNITIESIAGDNQVFANAGTTLAPRFVESKTAGNMSGDVPVVVTAMVNGSKVYLTSAEAEMSIACAPMKNYSQITDLQTETATLTVKVSTENGTQTVTKEFTVCNAPASAAKLAAVTGYDGTTSEALAASDCAITSLRGTAFNVKSQYGVVMTSVPDTATINIGVTKVEDSSSNDKTDVAKSGTDYVISRNDMQTAAIKVVTPGYKVTAKITITLANGETLEFEQKFKQS